jgi:hypothetical protein
MFDPQSISFNSWGEVEVAPPQLEVLQLFLLGLWEKALIATT